MEAKASARRPVTLGTLWEEVVDPRSIKPDYAASIAAASADIPAPGSIGGEGMSVPPICSLMSTLAQGSHD